VRVWLGASAHISHGGVLLLVTLLLASLGLIARLAIDLRQERANAGGAEAALRRRGANPPEVKPEASTVADPTVSWTPLLEAALSILVARSSEQLSLEGLLQELRLSLTDPTIKEHLTQQMQEAANARIVRIVRGSQTSLYYSLTPSGRDWAVGRLAAEKLKRASTGRRTTSSSPYNRPRHPLSSDRG
jgi:hypothetical protein